MSDLTRQSDPSSCPPIVANAVHSTETGMDQAASNAARNSITGAANLGTVADIAGNQTGQKAFSSSIIGVWARRGLACSFPAMLMVGFWWIDWRFAIPVVAGALVIVGAVGFRALSARRSNA